VILLVDVFTRPLPAGATTETLVQRSTYASKEVAWRPMSCNVMTTIHAPQMAATPVLDAYISKTMPPAPTEMYVRSETAVIQVHVTLAQRLLCAMTTIPVRTMSATQR